MKPLSSIRLFLTDVDGCLTDGGMYYTASGDEFKRFSVYDGMGMTLLRKAGIRCGILTSENTGIVLHRARKLCLDYLYMGVGRVVDKAQVKVFAPALSEPVLLPAMSKLEACQLICSEMGITMDQVCFVGDDVNDLSLLREVGFPVCPANAIEAVKQLPGIMQLPCQGGNGAIRYLADRILDARMEKNETNEI